PCARHARLGTPRPPTGPVAGPAQAETGPGGAARRRSCGPGPAGKTGCSPAWALAGLQRQPGHLGAGQVLVSLVKVAAGVVVGAGASWAWKASSSRYSS